MGKSKKWIWILAVLLPLGVCCAAIGSLAWRYVRPQPAPKSESLFLGIDYFREVRSTPRPMVIHILQVDLQADGIRPLVTPGDPDRSLPLSARRTSEFLADFDLQVAINGDQFHPYHSNSFFDYYPRSGDPVTVSGYAVSDGVAYSDDRPDAPTLYFARNNNARFNQPFNQNQQAISGVEMIVVNGRSVADPTDPQPRSAVGLNRGGRVLTMVVVDGRQPGYSEGATLSELAAILLDYNNHDAMNLDGGGSSSLVMENALGAGRLLNSPIDGSIPGRERVVANHLGFFARRD